MSPSHPVIVRDWRGLVVDPSRREFWTQGRRREAPSWPAQDPAPEVLSTAPRPEGAPDYPSAVIKLQRALQRAGWAVLVGYSRGPVRGQKTGTYRPMEHYGIHTGVHPGTGWRVQANYGRYVPDGTWSWRSIAIFRTDRYGRFLYATVTDLHEFVSVRGSIIPSWFEDIKRRELAKRATARVEEMGNA